MRAVITVIGYDRVGLIAGISAVLAESNVNILDIPLDHHAGSFTMMMLVILTALILIFPSLKTGLKVKEKSLALMSAYRGKKYSKACTGFRWNKDVCRH